MMIEATTTKCSEIYEETAVNRFCQYVALIDALFNFGMDWKQTNNKHKEQQRITLATTNAHTAIYDDKTKQKPTLIPQTLWVIWDTVVNIVCAFMYTHNKCGLIVLVHVVVVHLTFITKLVALFKYQHRKTISWWVWVCCLHVDNQQTHIPKCESVRSLATKQLYTVKLI